MKITLRKRSLYLILIGFALLWGGCFQKGPSERPLRVQLNHEPVSLDPALAEDGVALQVLYNTSEGLVGYDSAGKLQNRLAEQISVSEDGKKYEFTLRKGIQWSDGLPITVSHFVLALQRSLGPKSISKLSALLKMIKSVQEQDGKLIIRLERATPYFLQTLTLPPALPVRQDILDDHQGNWPEKAPSTGPYRVFSRQMGQKITLEKNPYYWDKAPQISKVEFLMIVDESTGLNLFRQGHLDILTRIPFLDYPSLKKQGRITTTPYLTTYYLSFNCRIPPFNDRNWRKAIAGVVNREEVAQLIGSGESPAWSWIPKGLEGFISYQDPRKIFSDSIELIQKKAKTQGSISAAFDTGARNQKIMEKVQQDIQTGLGLKVVLNELDWKTYIGTLQSKAPSLFRFAWMSPFMDPVSHLRVFATGNLNNHSGFSNIRYDRLVNEIETLSPGPEREKKIHDAQQILLNEEAALVPLYHYVQNSAVSEKVHHFNSNPFGMIRIQELTLE